jgi:hypothetical protein
VKSEIPAGDYMKTSVLVLTPAGCGSKPADMPRQLRIEYPGAIYHPPAFDFGATSVMNRGVLCEPTFLDDTDRKRFVSAWRDGYE